MNERLRSQSTGVKLCVCESLSTRDHTSQHHRVGVGSWEGRNFYQIRPASEVCNFYKIRPEIWDQLLHFEARFQFFSAGAPPSAAVLGSNFRLVRLDLGPVQDVGIPVREHSAGIKTSKSEFWGGQNPHFFRPAGATVSTARWPVLDMPSRGRPGRELSMASSFYRFMARSAAFTN